MVDNATQSMRPASNMTSMFRTGWGLVIALFGGLFLWSVLAPFEGAVLASGLISVESNQQAVQHLEGGIVGKIHVKEADRVESGQILIELDDTAIRARLSSVEARLFESIGEEARLLAERDGRDELNLQERFRDLATRRKIISILASQQDLLQARAASRSTQVSLLNQTIRQLQRRASGLVNEIEANLEQGELIGDEVSGLEELLAKGLSPRSRVLSLKREQARLTGAREALSAEVATTRIQIGEARLEVNQLTEGFREEVLTELRAVQTRIAELAEERIAARDQLQRLEIKAPRSGRVIGVQTHTLGGVIEPRNPIMFVVPEGDPLVALVRIAPQDIDKVQEGDDAILRFPAFSANVTPEVYGTVRKVSADALQDPASGIFYYESVVEIPEDRQSNLDFQLLPGMPVDASVNTGRRTVISYLLKPLGDAMSQTFRE